MSTDPETTHLPFTADRYSRERFTEGTIKNSVFLVIGIREVEYAVQYIKE